jgi:hypothetical protein
MVTPSEQDPPDQADAKLIETAKARNSDGLGFLRRCVAAPGLSGIYGSQRI